MPIRVDGNIRIHGPFLSRCHGLGELPAKLADQLPSDDPSQHSPPFYSDVSTLATIESTINPGLIEVKILFVEHLSL